MSGAAIFWKNGATGLSMEKGGDSRFMSAQRLESAPPGSTDELVCRVKIVDRSLGHNDVYRVLRITA